MTIAEVSKTFGLTADTLRYYERIGLIPPVKRSSSGIRDYDEKDCNWVEFIKCMRGVGIPVEMLIEYVAMFRLGKETIAARSSFGRAKTAACRQDSSYAGCTGTVRYENRWL